MTMYVVAVGTNAETAIPNYADRAGFDFYGPFTRMVADEMADAVRAELAKHGPEAFVNGEVVVEVTRLASYIATGRDAVARFVSAEAN